jgi:hypothetical protein
VQASGCCGRGGHLEQLAKYPGIAAQLVLGAWAPEFAAYGLPGEAAEAAGDGVGWGREIAAERGGGAGAELVALAGSRSSTR